MADLKSNNLLYLCDWLPPDFGAVGQYELASAREYARRGFEVTLVGFNSQRTTEEIVEEGAGRVIVRRLHRPAYDRSTWVKRAAWTLFANAALVWHARKALTSAAEIRFTGSPPYLLHFVMPIALLLRKPTRYRISDFHPECMIAALGRQPLWLRAVLTLTVFWRRRVTRFEVLGEDQRRRLIAQGIPAARIELKRDSTPVPISGNEAGTLRPPEMQGRFILLYSGNWGRAHDSATFIRAVRALPEDVKTRLGIWLNCIGHEGQVVFRNLNDEPGIVIKRTRPRLLKDLPELLASADCHLITLKDAFVGYVLPSKVYGCIASRKPILYIGSRGSDVHLLCSEQAAGRYHQVDCGDAAKTGNILRLLING